MIQPPKALWAIVGLLTQLHLTDDNPYQPWQWTMARLDNQKVVQKETTSDKPPSLPCGEAFFLTLPPY